MNFTKDNLRLYAVTDRSWLRGQTLMQQVEQALLGGATLVQLREKELEATASACRCSSTIMWKLPEKAARTAYTSGRRIWKPRRYAGFWAPA